MKEKESRISVHDKISRHFNWIILLFVTSSVLDIPYTGFQWMSEIGGPEFIAITISVVALILSGAEFFRSHMLETRQDDIKALHGLRIFRSIMESPKEAKSKFHFDELRNTAHSVMENWSLRLLKS